MTSGNNRYLTLFSEFSKVLAHKLRTPLSVVSNELFFLQTSTPALDVKASMAKCQEVSSILSDACKLWENPPQNRKELIEAVKTGIQLAFHVKEVEAIDSKFVFRNTNPQAPSGNGRYQSFTEYSSALGAIDSLHPVFMDTIVWAHGGEVEVAVHATTTTISLSFN